MEIPMEQEEADQLLSKNRPPLYDMDINEKPNVDEHENGHSNNVLFYVLFGLLNLIGVLSLALACTWAQVYMKGFAWDGGPKNFNWHPVFMTCYILLYGNAAIIYRLLRNMEKFKAKLIHAGLNFAAFIFAVVGLEAAFHFHNTLSIPNMYSLHSWVGIASVSLYAFQLVFGVISFLYPKFSNDDVRRSYLHIHVFFGVLILVLALVAAVSGITEKMLFGFKSVYGKFVPVTYVANFFGVTITLFGMIVGYILYNSSWKRVG